jgi:hypothetical protein
VQLAEVQRTAGLFNVAKHTAGADRGKLLIITDQADTRTGIDCEVHGRVEGVGVGHARFVDDQQSRPSRPRPPSPEGRRDQVTS